MRANLGLWWIISGFSFLIAVVYIGWSIIAHPNVPWYEGIEWVGAVALTFGGFMAALVAFYVQRVFSAQGGPLPEDVTTADIDDGDPELGEFSPWSWWPLVLAGSAALGMMGLAVGVWLFPIGLSVFAVAIIGWVFEYYRGHFAR